MNNIQRISKRFASSFQFFLPIKSIKHAYQLAREAIVSIFRMHVNPPCQTKSTLQTTCSICLDDDIMIYKMFSVDKCRHRFCSECMKRHIEVKLLEGSSVIMCPYYRCKSKLTFGSCENLLTHKLRKMWQQRIKEESIPLTNRIYCPNPRCSALISVNDLSKSSNESGFRRYFSKTTKEARFRRYCFQCGQLFCINCKAPWHDMSCDDYKGLGKNPTEDDIKLKALANQKLWRQCGKCQQMIELSEGCVKVKCRCGHKFCYKCGAKAGGCGHAAFHIYPQ